MSEKSSVCKKVYIVDGDEGSTEHKSATPEAARLEFRFDGGHVESISVDQFPQAIRDCATLHGLSQKLGDAYAGAKGDVDAAIESFGGLLERLQAGEWVKARESAGPRLSMIFQAVVKVYADAGVTLDDAKAAEIQEALKDKAFREETTSNLKIKAALEQLRAEAAAARAAKAAEAAASDTGPEESDPLGIMG